KFYYKFGFILIHSITVYKTKPFLLFQTSIQSLQKDYKIKLFYSITLSKKRQGDLHIGAIVDWRLFRQDWQSWSAVQVIPLNKRIKRPWMKVPKRIMYSTSEKFGKGEFLSDNFAIIKNLKTQQFITLGFISMKDYLTHIGIHVNYEKDEILKLFAQSLLGEIPLRENIKISSEKLVLIINGMNAVESLDYYAVLVQKEMNAISWDTIPTGWCSWYYYYYRVSEDAVLQNSEFLSNNKALPVEWVQLDDGYIPKKWINVRIGDWLEVNDRFPHGLEWLAKEIRAKGFKPGLWIAPFIVSKASKVYKEHPEWVIHDKKGKPILVNINPEWGTFNKFYGLDCTHPEVQEWLRILFKIIIKEWRYQFIKIDFIYAAAINGVFHNPSLTRIQAYRKGLEIIRETVGDNVFILGCGAPLGPSIGLVNGMRIGGDTYYAFNQPFLYWFLNNFFFAGLGDMPSMKSALNSIVLRSFMHNKFWINDPDCLLVRRTRSNLKPYEIEFEVTLFGLCGGILLSSDNLTELTPKDLEYIKFLLPPTKDPAIPIDLFEKIPPMYLKLEISSNPLFAPYYLVGIFNWTKKEKKVLISPEVLQINPKVTYHVFDFWEKRYFQINSGSSKPRLLKKHSAKLLVIRSLTKKPQLIASTFHFSQGAVEITNFTFNSQKYEISIEVTKAGPNHGFLYLFLPPSYQEKELISNTYHNSMFRHEDGLLVIEIRFEDKVQITIKLKKS
ncbi:MAG: glycoside hydrolase family 36 protein, partial [Promethearchaeota archaeon]